MLLPKDHGNMMWWAGWGGAQFWHRGQLGKSPYMQTEVATGQTQRYMKDG